MFFNGVSKDYLKLTKGKIRPTFAPVTRNVLTVPGRPGGFLQSTDTNVRVLTVPVVIIGDNLQKIKEDLASWLITEEACELIFPDELDRVYYAVVDGSVDLDEIVDFGEGVITFICTDPYKYSHEKTVSNPNAFFVEGTAQTEPIIKAVIGADTTFIAVSDGDKLNLIGNPVKAEEAPYEPESPVFINGCNSLVGWTNSSSTSLEGTIQLGTLKTNGDFYTDDYGVMSGAWHGPAMKTSIGQVLQDFRFDVGFTMAKTGANQAGSIEVSLLDASNNIVARVSMTKHFGGLDYLYARSRVGTSAIGFDVINENAAKSIAQITGIFRLKRKGNTWNAELFYYHEGKYHLGYSNSWVDTTNIYMAPVTQVQARLLQRGDFPVVQQRIADINIYKLNDPTAGQVPIVARAGDVIEFNHKDEVILKNGESILKEKAFIGEFFPLKQGLNTIVVEPAEAIQSVEVKWRDKWL
jgi:predicted phage tail component-like protein